MKLIFKSSSVGSGDMNTEMKVSKEETGILKLLCDERIHHDPMKGLVKTYILNRMEFEIEEDGE